MPPALRVPQISAILLLALALRLVWALTIPVEPVSDAAAYDIFARNIAGHGVYGFTPDAPSAYWAVGTAAIYAAAYMAFGAGGLAVVVVNLASSMAIVWLLWLLGRRWFDETTGRLAALIFALWPLTIQYVTVLASELHFMALSLAGLWAWDRARDSGQRWLFLLLSGIFLAAATYIRPIALLIPATLALAAICRAPRRAGGPVLRAALVTGLIFALVTPWSLRNERVLGERAFVSTNFWANFWMGNHPGTDGEYAPLPPDVESLGELERAVILRERSLDYLRQAPGAFVTRTLWKAVRLHRAETIGVAWNRAAIERRAGPAGVTLLRLVSAGYWFAMLAAALAGVVRLAGARGLWQALLAPPVILWIYFTAIHAVIVVGDRYHMPAIPMIALLAGYALAGIRIVGRRPALR
ncbi:ArnT family glycosyltransferase [Tropicimonas sp.]|uniref:ArnT family glycosyltransferase n=1 Tax=Tropicimonas sp. TaxID=2067044 RepID=UPI003A8762CE